MAELWNIKCTLWLQGLGMPDYAEYLAKLKNQPRVCSKHFPQSSYESIKVLKKDAVPMIHPPPPNIDIIKEQRSISCQTDNDMCGSISNQTVSETKTDKELSHICSQSNNIENTPRKRKFKTESKIAAKRLKMTEKELKTKQTITKEDFVKYMETHLDRNLVEYIKCQMLVKQEFQNNRADSVGFSHHHCYDSVSEHHNTYDVRSSQNTSRTIETKSGGVNSSSRKKRPTSKLHKLCSISAGKGQHVCEVCKKRLTSSDSLRKHMRIHDRERPYSCNVCNMRFICKSELDIHCVVHGERPHKCDVCGKCFKFKISAVNHMKTHSGEGLYSCTDCSKCFITKAHLTSHLLIHIGEHPPACDVVKLENNFSD